MEDDDGITEEQYDELEQRLTDLERRIEHLEMRGNEGSTALTNQTRLIHYLSELTRRLGEHLDLDLPGPPSLEDPSSDRTTADEESSSSGGLDRLKDQLQTLFRDSLNMPGGAVPELDELFPNQFLSERTEFETLDAFLEASPLEGHQGVDESVFLESEFDDFVRKRTDFGSWTAMRQEIEVNWLNKHIG